MPIYGLGTKFSDSLLSGDRKRLFQRLLKEMGEKIVHP